jgi:hypothetical protein
MIGEWFRLNLHRERTHSGEACAPGADQIAWLFAGQEIMQGCAGRRRSYALSRGNILYQIIRRRVATYLSTVMDTGAS